MNRDQLDALIDAQGFTVNMCADPGCRAEHEVLEISDLIAILAVVPPEPEKCHDSHKYTEPCEYHRGWKDGADEVLSRLSAVVPEPPAPDTTSRALEIVKQLREWDMLWLDENGFGKATADAPWAQALLNELQVLLGAAAPEPPTPESES